MKKHVQDRIDELNQKVSDYSEMITVINNDIENGELIPTDNQKITIGYIATQARKIVTEIERLENLIGILPNDEE